MGLSPPLERSSLAWIAPIWWILLIRKKELTGRRPYAQLWFAGFLFWMAELHFLRLPHPATSIGWVAISLYLACYLPVFVACSRVAVHQLRLPVILVAPVVWTGLELARGHLLTGFTMASLGHSQYSLIWLIQFAQLFGAYGVSFVVMFIAACLARIWPLEESGEKTRGFVFWPIIPIAVVLPVLYLYGIVQQEPESREEPVRIAIIQGSIDTEFKSDPNLADRVMEEYRNLSREAVDRFKPVDLVVWPETMFRTPLTTCDEDAALPPDCPLTLEEFRDHAERASRITAESVQDYAEWLGTPILVGIDRCHYGTDGQYLFNSAVLATPKDGVVDHYDKMHLVLFGEYVPLGKAFPWLQRLTPLPVSLDAGTKPACFRGQGDPPFAEHLLRKRPASRHSTAGPRRQDGSRISRRPGHSDKRRVVLGIERARPASHLRRLSRRGDRTPCDYCGKHRVLRVDWSERTHPGEGPAAEDGDPVGKDHSLRS